MVDYYRNPDEYISENYDNNINEANYNAFYGDSDFLSLPSQTENTPPLDSYSSYSSSVTDHDQFSQPVEIIDDNSGNFINSSIPLPTPPKSLSNSPSFPSPVARQIVSSTPRSSDRPSSRPSSRSSDRPSSRSSDRPSSRSSSKPLSPLSPLRSNIKSSIPEDLLISNGYVPIKSIVVDNHDSTSDYILAYNKRGQYVLINLNNKVQRVLGKIVHTEIIKDDSSVPYSLKKGSFECSNGVCGVAYDSDKQLNLVTRDEFSFQPKSDTLIYKGDNIVAIGDNIPIPIINYNDIVHDPQTTLKNTYETTSRLYSSIYENCKQGMIASTTEFKVLESQLKNFMISEVDFAKDLADSIEVLRHFAMQYETEVPTNDKEKRNYELVKFNLKKRSDLFILLINCCKQYCNMKTHFVDLTQQLKELQELCTREFAGVDKILTP